MNTSGSSSATASRMDTVPRRINLTIDEVVIMSEASIRLCLSLPLVRRHGAVASEREGAFGRGFCFLLGQSDKISETGQLQSQKARRVTRRHGWTREGQGSRRRTRRRRRGPRTRPKRARQRGTFRMGRRRRRRRRTGFVIASRRWPLRCRGRGRLRGSEGRGSRDVLPGIRRRPEAQAPPDAPGVRPRRCRREASPQARRPR